MSALVRDAMVTNPVMLEAGATAQSAGECLADTDVRAVLVCEPDGKLIGVVTRKTLVREVVARGLDPGTTTLATFAESPYYVIEASTLLEDAFRQLEEHDLERVPVVEKGRLVGVLSRAVIQRRLAEDEPPPEPVEA